MKLQNLTVIFIIIILPIVLVLSAYIGYEVQTIKKQNMYNNGLVSATHDAIFAFELNTKNDVYYNNAESKRSNIKAAVKTFENSLSNTCNLGLYNNQAIEEYIPAIVFGLYDGFYMYAPTQTQNQEYKHDLKNYVYYSEEIKQGNIDIIIRYTLDNYVAVSGTIGDKYVTKAGYLINLNDLPNRNSELKDKELKDINKVTYKNVTIEKEHIEEYGKDKDTGEINKVIDNPDNDLAISYYKKAYEFTNWFIYEAKIGQTKKYLKIGDENDPEDENSPFVQHKREIMKNKIQSILNSSITAYSNKTRNNYKMPVLRAEDWDKIYNNISVISFVQGINLGFKNYNHYCVLNSTNSQEYVNPNLIYFTDGNSYHDIRCIDTNVDWPKAVGYKIGSFEKQNYEHEVEEDGKKETKKDYYYKHNELACYSCINGTQRVNKNIYNYMNGIDENSITEKANDVQKKVYYSALARERESTVKLLNAYNSETLRQYTITYEEGDTKGKEVTGMPKAQTVIEGEPFTIPSEVPTAEGLTFVKWKVKGSNTEFGSGIEIPATGNITLVAQWEEIKDIEITIYNIDNNEMIKKIKYNPGNKDSYMNFTYRIVNRKREKYYTTEKTITSDSKYGFTLKGIYDNIECNGTDYNGKGYTFIQTSINLYAKYERNNFTVTYHYTNSNTVITDNIPYEDNVTIKDTPTHSDGKYFVAWTSNSVDYSPGDTLQVLGNIDLYLKIVNPSIELQYNNNNTWSTLYLNEEKYTNKEKIRVISSRKPDKYLKFYIDNSEYGENGKEYVTDDNRINEINVKYKFKIFNSKGEEITEITDTKYIMVDRKPPVVYNVKPFTNVFKYVEAYVEDEGSGISTVKIKPSNTSYNMNKDEDTTNRYWRNVATKEDQKYGTINVSDKAGNVTPYSYSFPDFK